MTDDQLIQGLNHLGIDAVNARVVMLLPLVQVAWADGKVQPGEKSAILGIAKREGVLDDQAVKLLDGWLTSAPSHEYHAKAHDVIRELARRNGGLGSDITPESVDTIVNYCGKVAASAGGLFGLMFTVSAVEKRVIADIAQELRIVASEGGAAPGAGWDELMMDLSTSRVPPPREE
jgi:hypothetical protein